MDKLPALFYSELFAHLSVNATETIKKVNSTILQSHAAHYSQECQRLALLIKPVNQASCEYVFREFEMSRGSGWILFSLEQIASLKARGLFRLQEILLTPHELNNGAVQSGEITYENLEKLLFATILPYDIQFSSKVQENHQDAFLKMLDLFDAQNLTFWRLYLNYCATTAASEEKLWKFIDSSVSHKLDTIFLVGAWPESSFPYLMRYSISQVSTICITGAQLPMKIEFLKNIVRDVLRIGKRQFLLEGNYSGTSAELTGAFIKLSKDTWASECSNSGMFFDIINNQINIKLILRENNDFE